MLTFNGDGLSLIDFGDAPILVASPDLRRNGRAAAEGIPTFQYRELRQPAKVRVRMQQAMPTYTWPGPDTTPEFVEPIYVNPATGLTMTGNQPGGLDAGGNLWG